MTISDLFTMCLHVKLYINFLYFQHQEKIHVYVYYPTGIFDFVGIL